MHILARTDLRPMTGLRVLRRDAARSRAAGNGRSRSCDNGDEYQDQNRTNGGSPCGDGPTASANLRQTHERIV
jgi:hypothetical protein